MEQQDIIPIVDLSAQLGYGLIYQPIIGQKPASINCPLPIRLHRKCLRQPKRR